ncbi:MAG: helicase C-terminal domain-containing protein, partial [Chloroflexota bacterium]
KENVTFVSAGKSQFDFSGRFVVSNVATLVNRLEALNPDEYGLVIVDEAHHLEGATTGALSFKLSQNDFELLLKEIGGSNNGILGHIISSTRNLIKPTEFARINQIIQKSSEITFRLDTYAKDFFLALNEFISIQREGKPPTQYAYQERILHSSRTLPGWDNVEINWGSASESMSFLITNISELFKACAELYANGAEMMEDSVDSLSTLLRRMNEVISAINGMIHEPSADTIYWIEVQPMNRRLTLNTAPLRVGPLIEKYLWHDKSCVILTSATLTAAGDFTYLRNLLLADEADELTLGSPFDYENSALLYLPNDIPEPNAPGYESAVNKAIIQTARATGGRMLVLFTSYAHLKRTSQAITQSLNQNDIQIYEQGEGASPASLLEAFKSNPRSVLLGTRSFWEGVDVPGESLSVVFITRIPFEVPSDPLVAARSETFEDAFNEYQVPEAILKFRQGFGRLIRSASDRGIVAILDRRVMTKQYGRLFIESLPRCTIQTASINDLPKQATNWLL